jgi:hypothetical protein
MGGKKIAELQEMCRIRGLSTDGNRSELQEKIKSFDLQKKSKPMATDTLAKKKSQGEIFPLASTILTSPCLHIRANNLPNYFNFGIIYPLDLEQSEIYRNENRERDILSLFPGYIVLSFGAINTFEDGDVLIEIIIDKLDYIEVEEKAFIAVTHPIPISRIKTVFFKNENALRHLLASVNSYQDCFLPETVCKVFKGDLPFLDLEVLNTKLPRNEKLQQWQRISARFDRLMGIFAFIKNAGLFYGNRTNQLDEYTRSYFGVLALINPIEELLNFKINSFIKQLVYYNEAEQSQEHLLLYRIILEKIYANETFSLNNAIAILEKIVNERPAADDKNRLHELTRLLKSLDNYTISFKEILNLNAIRDHIPFLCLLFLTKFSNKERSNSDKQAVRNVLIQETNSIPINVAETILSNLGAYYGYKNMPRQDTNLTLNDRNFQLVANQVQSIKFRMDSYLDRFTVESCFQFAISGRSISDGYSFLKWRDEDGVKAPVFTSQDLEYIVRQVPVLSYKILTISRIDEVDKLLTALKSIFPERIPSESYLVTYFLKYGILDSRYIIDQIRMYSHRFPKGELRDILEIEKVKSKTKS